MQSNLKKISLFLSFLIITPCINANEITIANPMGGDSAANIMKDKNNPPTATRAQTNQISQTNFDEKTLGLPPTKEGAPMQQAQNSSPIKMEDISEMYPLTRDATLDTKTPNLKIDEYKLNIDSKTVKEVIKADKKYYRLFTGLYDSSMLQKPLSRPLSSIDSIKVNGEYITSIKFPSGFRINNVKSSQKFTTLDFSENLLLIQPDRGFIEGNIIVSAFDFKKQQNQFFSLLISKYFPKDVSVDSKASRYIACGEYISTIINYIEEPNIKNIDVLKMYFQAFGEKSIKRFSKNGDFDSIIIRGFPFFIIRDDNFGSLEYNGVNFDIANKYTKFAEKIK